MGKFSLYGQNVRTQLYGKSSLLKLTNFIYKKNEDKILVITHYLVCRGPLIWLNLFSCFQCCRFLTVQKGSYFQSR